MRGIFARSMLRTPPHAVLDRNAVCMGDSLSNPTGGGAGWPPALQSLIGSPCRVRADANTFQGGANSTTILALNQADSTRTEGWAVIWVGSNFSDASPLTTVPANVAAMDALVRNRAIIVGLIMGDYADNYIGTGAQRADKLAVIATLAATYGNRFIDMHAYLMSLSTHAGADATDDANGVTPTSTRGDLIHPNAATNALIAALINSKRIALGF